MHLPDVPPREVTAQEEYRSLRETIQRRGSLRVALAVAGWGAWAALALWSWTTGTRPLVASIPLIVLAGTFEAVLALHTGVERIGRYVQLMFESGETAPPAWEHTAVAMSGRWLSPGGLDPLFGVIFVLAAFANLLPVLVDGTPLELSAGAAIHLVFIARVLLARRFSAAQRAADIAALTQVISSKSLVSRIQQER